VLKNVTLTREVVKFVVTQPLPPDKNGSWLDYAMIPSSFTHTHPKARIMQPPIAHFFQGGKGVVRDA